MPIVVNTGTGAAPGTVGALADRVYREYLHPGDDQPVVVTLASNVQATDLDWSLDVTMLAADEVDLIAGGVVLDTVDGEQVLVVSFEPSTSIARVRRGHAGTDPTFHSANEPVTIAPVFGRQAVLDAVAGNIVGLHPTLWRTGTVKVTTSHDFIEVPESVLTVVELLWSSGRGWGSGSAQLLDRFPPSSTGKAIVARGVPCDVEAYLTFRGRFDRPAGPSTPIASLGVDPAWERIVVVGAAAQIAAGRDLDQLTAEYVTEQLEREALPNEAPGRVRDGLLRLYQFWLDQASRGLRTERNHPVVYESPGLQGRR